MGTNKCKSQAYFIIHPWQHFVFGLKRVKVIVLYRSKNATNSVYWNLIALMMEAVNTSVTSVYFYETTWIIIPAGSHLSTRNSENMTSSNGLLK
jgi:hypothetical protein